MTDRYGPNPFQPAQGGSPPHLAGRLELLERFVRGLDAPGSLERSTWFTGARGMGKTVMLDEVRDVAEQRGWRVVTETGDPGFVDRLANVRLPRLMGDLAVRDRTYRLKGANALGFGVDWESGERFPAAADLRSRIEQATDLIVRKDGAGLLITLDELHIADPAEVGRLGAVLQHCVREERTVAFASAGLPMVTDDGVIQEPTLRLLRHGDRVELGMLSPGDVAEAIAVPIEQAGRRITPDALDVAVDAVRGYPVLTQHIGDALWTAAGDRREIGLRDAERAVQHVIAHVGVRVHDTTLRDLDRADRDFLVAMAPDHGPSSIADVARRLGIERADADRSRARLLSAGLVHERGAERLGLTLPYLRQHLRSFGPRLSTATRARDVNRAQLQPASPGLDL